MILPHHGKWPEIHETAFVAPSSDVIGEVAIGAQSSIWFQCVVRGDVNWIRIGSRTNVQDQTVLHVTRQAHPLIIGDEVTIGHRVTLHGCTLGDRILVGMGAIILDGAVIGDDCIIGAGALVTKGTIVPSRSLVIGAPARVSRELRDDEVAFLKKSAQNYVNDSIGYIQYVRGPGKLGDDREDLESINDEDEGETLEGEQ